MTRAILLLPPALLLLAACGGAPSALEVEDLGPGQVAYFSADGGVVVKGRYGVCVVPPIDGVAEIAERSRSETEEGEDADAVAFFQLGMYRLCEMKINQNLSYADHRKLVRRLIASTNRLLKSKTKRAEAAKADAEARKAAAEARKAEVEAGLAAPASATPDAGPGQLLVPSPYND
jgi:hypothetical protein